MSYNHYCACGKMLEARLEQLGAKRFSGRADINREDWKAVDAWIKAAVEGLNVPDLPRHAHAGRTTISAPVAKCWTRVWSSWAPSASRGVLTSIERTGRL